MGIPIVVSPEQVLLLKVFTSCSAENSKIVDFLKLMELITKKNRDSTFFNRDADRNKNFAKSQSFPKCSQKLKLPLHSEIFSVQPMGLNWENVERLLL